MQIEFDILYALQHLHNAVLDPIMVFITSLGNGGMLWLGLAIFFCFTKKYRTSGILMLLSIMVAGLVGNVALKNLVQRDRPCWIDPSIDLLVKNPKDYSFPSGHSFVSFATSTTLFLQHKKLGTPFVILAGLIAFSRLYMFVHFPTDVLFGVVAGILDAMLVTFIYHKVEQRRENNGVKRS